MVGAECGWGRGEDKGYVVVGRVGVGGGAGMTGMPMAWNGKADR